MVTRPLLERANLEASTELLSATRLVRRSGEGELSGREKNSKTERVGEKPFGKKLIVPFLATLVLASVHLAQAQQPKVYRVGVVHEGGPFGVAIDGLKDGLREFGFTEGKQYVLAIHDVQGDPKAIEAAAKSLEKEKVDLIYTVGSSVTIAAKRATTAVPIVFATGSDPIRAGMVESFARPWGAHYGRPLFLG